MRQVTQDAASWDQFPTDFTSVGYLKQKLTPLPALSKDVFYINE